MLNYIKVFISCSLNLCVNSNMQLIPREMLFDIMAHKRPVKFKSLDSLQEHDEFDSMF